MLAFLFPGQASQFVGMGKDIVENVPSCKQTLEEADDILGFSLSRLSLEGPSEQLERTAIAQPAILSISVAIWRVLDANRIRPQVVAGHSLGEYSALVAAGALAFRDALVLVRKRGTYMQEAVPIGKGAMAAIIGMEHQMVESVCGQVCGEEVLTAANFNAPGQTVISGHSGAVERAIALARERGARRAIHLSVSAPFHCSLMAPAAKRLRCDLDSTIFNDLDVPLISNVTAQPVTTGEEARAALIQQVTSPVLWEESVKTLASMPVHRALEVGPSQVLTGLVKRTDRSIQCLPVGTLDGLNACLESFR